MKRLLQLLLISVLLSAACGVESPLAPQRVPGWLTSLIHEQEAAPVASPSALIARYEYRGQIVYYLPPRCCDIGGNLYQMDGTILCHPGGGFDGNGDGRCPDFFAARKNEQIIWRDPRSPAQ